MHSISSMGLKSLLSDCLQRSGLNGLVGKVMGLAVAGGYFIWNVRCCHSLVGRLREFYSGECWSAKTVINLAELSHQVSKGAEWHAKAREVVQWICGNEMPFETMREFAQQAQQVEKDPSGLESAWQELLGAHLKSVCEGEEIIHLWDLQERLLVADMLAMCGKHVEAKQQVQDAYSEVIESEESGYMLRELTRWAASLGEPPYGTCTQQFITEKLPEALKVLLEKIQESATQNNISSEENLLMDTPVHCLILWLRVAKICEIDLQPAKELIPTLEGSLKDCVLLSTWALLYAELPEQKEKSLELLQQAMKTYDDADVYADDAIEIVSALHSDTKKSSEVETQAIQRIEKEISESLQADLMDLSPSVTSSTPYSLRQKMAEAYIKLFQGFGNVLDEDSEKYLTEACRVVGLAGVTENLTHVLLPQIENSVLPPKDKCGYLFDLISALFKNGAAQEKVLNTCIEQALSYLPHIQDPDEYAYVIAGFMARKAMMHGRKGEDIGPLEDDLILQENPTATALQEAWEQSASREVLISQQGLDQYINQSHSSLAELEKLLPPDPEEAAQPLLLPRQPTKSNQQLLTQLEKLQQLNDTSGQKKHIQEAKNSLAKVKTCVQQLDAALQQAEQSMDSLQSWSAGPKALKQQLEQALTAATQMQNDYDAEQQNLQRARQLIEQFHPSWGQLASHVVGVVATVATCCFSSWTFGVLMTAPLCYKLTFHTVDLLRPLANSRGVDVPKNT